MKALSKVFTILLLPVAAFICLLVFQARGEKEKSSDTAMARTKITVQFHRHNLSGDVDDVPVSKKCEAVRKALEDHAIAGWEMKHNGRNLSEGNACQKPEIKGPRVNIAQKADFADANALSEFMDEINK